MRWLPLAITPSVLAGCSLIYNPSNLPAPGTDAAVDAGPDAEIILDADPRMVTLDAVSPLAIYEGQGESGSQPALVVIHGQHIVDNATTVAITPATGNAMLTVGTPVVAKNGRWIAVPVTAAVDGSLNQGATIALDVTLTQSLPAEAGGGTATATLRDQLRLVGLKELNRNTTPEVTVAGSVVTLDTTKLEERYSKVDFATPPVGTLLFAGANRAIIRSMSSITTGSLQAKGVAAVAVAGGCPGGEAQSTGGCDGTIGGHGGGAPVLGSAGGGGGGGFVAAGAPGGGSTNAGPGGARTGDALIVRYDGASPNLGGGGGGGGNPTLSALGGRGGASGGAIDLHADGDLRVQGAINVDGGVGTNGGSGLATSAAGGGGAGGIAMLRAGGALTISDPVSAKGGAGGAGTGGHGSGGAGADGRVRWDAPSGTAPITNAGTTRRGPAFTVANRLFREPEATITLIGTANDRFNVYYIHGDSIEPGPQGRSFGVNGTASFNITLPQGHNRLCITLEGGQQGSAESDKCIDIAFLP